MQIQHRSVILFQKRTEVLIWDNMAGVQTHGSFLFSAVYCM